MTNILGGGAGANAKQIIKYTGLQIQTSAQGMCIPIVWGTNVIAHNLIWQENFQAHPVNGKGGGKGASGKGATQWTYTEALILALCEGPITGINTVWADGAVSSLSSLNLQLFTGTNSQTPATWIASNYPAEARAYRGTAYVFSSYFDLSGSATIPSLKFEVQGALYGQVSGSADVSFANIIYDYLTNTQYGIANFPSATIDPVSFAAFQTYCLAQNLLASPALDTQEQGIQTLQRWTALCNTWIFWSGNLLKFVPLGDAAITGNGVTYTPTTTAVYALGPDDYIFDKDNEDPIEVAIIDPADGYNRVQLDVRDRANSYADTPVYWEDQATIDQLGLLQSNIISAREVCDTGIAATMAALIGQRTVYLRNTYTFKLAYTFVLLEPGDIVTLTEPNIGLVNLPVRILTIEEKSDYLLEVTAEPFPGTIGTILYQRPQQTATGTVRPGADAQPGNVNPPLIVEPPVSVTGGVPQVWVGLSGGQYWGGADAYVSADGTNYGWIGRVGIPTVQGTLVYPIFAVADPDLIETLTVNTAESLQALSAGVSNSDADAFRTACLVDQEILSYGTCNPVGTFEYGLTYLRRGGYGTTVAGHSAGAQFWRINPTACIQYTLPKAYVGQTLYFKFTSFNIFGGNEQTLSEATEYTYVPTGVAFAILPPSGVTLAAGSQVQSDGTTLLYMVLTWQASLGPALGSYELQWSADGGASWYLDYVVGNLSLSYRLAPAAERTFYQARIRAISQNGLAQSVWEYSTVVESAGIQPAGVAPLPARPLRLNLPPPDIAPPEYLPPTVRASLARTLPIAPFVRRFAPVEPPDEVPRFLALRAQANGLAWSFLDNGSALILDASGGVILVSVI